MASNFDRPRRAFDIVGLFRFCGYALLVLAGVVGYFHTKIWMIHAHGNPFNALCGAIGVLMLTALLPLFVITIARSWRETEYARLEGAAAQLYDLLRRRSGELAMRDIINRMIAVYGIASGVSARVARFLLVALSLCVVVCALYLDKLAAAHTFTHNQANLLIVFMLLATFAFWCLMWPERDRAEQFDPSDVLAAAIH
jgi:hypothetical protein